MFALCQLSLVFGALRANTTAVGVCTQSGYCVPWAAGTAHFMEMGGTPWRTPIYDPRGGPQPLSMGRIRVGNVGSGSQVRREHPNPLILYSVLGVPENESLLYTLRTHKRRRTFVRCLGELDSRFVSVQFSLRLFYSDPDDAKTPPEILERPKSVVCRAGKYFNNDSILNI